MDANFSAKIDNFNDYQYWEIGASITQGYIGYSPDDGKTLRVVCKSDFTTVAECAYPSNFKFLIDENGLKYVLDKYEVYSLDFLTQNVVKLWNGQFSDHTYVAFLDFNHVFEDVRIRKKRKVVSKTLRIIDLRSKSVIASFNDDFEFLKRIDSFGLFVHLKTLRLELRDLSTGSAVWSIEIDGEPWIDYSIVDETEIYLVVQCSDRQDLLKIDISTGDVVWSVKNVASQFFLHDKNIVQMQGAMLHVYDRNTGALVHENEFEELNRRQIRVHSHLCDLDRNTLYFSSFEGSGDGKQSVLGAINLNTYILDMCELPLTDNQYDARSPQGRVFADADSVYLIMANTLLKYSINSLI